ncbi:MAG TPA: T9SS type A sorting domain-containing protein, partial [Chitinophagales bacterium]|nr:T9SS type A sorting domain-containing protein [Chitinophagales bacterium]
SPIQFSPNPQAVAIEKGESIYYNGLFGYLFNNGTSSDAVIMNLTGNTQVLSTSEMFPSGGTYEMRYAPALRLIATAEDVTIINNSLPQSLTLQPYSITRISASTVPAAPPTVSITVNGPVTFCAGDSVQLDAGANHYSYVWSNGKTSRKIWAKSTGDYSVKAYDSPAGYYGEATVHITVNPNPTKPNIKVDDPKKFCAGGSALVYLGPNFTYTNVSYLWPLTGQTTPQAQISSSGNHYLMITDQNGCYTVSDTETITVYPLPQPVIAPIGAAQACYDVGVTLQTNQAYVNYDWSGGGNLQSKKYTVSGTYWVSVKDNNGCQANSNAVNVTIWEPAYPNITALGPTTYCIETPTTLSTIPGYSYQWLKGGVVISGGTTQTWAPTSSGLYKVSVTDPHGCSKKNDTGVDITVNSLSAPAITVSNGSLLCQGETTQLSMPSGYYGYTWSTGATGSNIIVGSSGSYTCTITDANGCVSTSPAKIITVNPLPQPVITPAGPTSFCYDQSVSLSAQAGYNQYTWSNGKSGQTVTAETNGPITVVVKDVNNCYGTSPAINLTVWEPPVPTVSCAGPTTYCIENPSTLSTISGYAYQWKKGLTVLSNATNATYQPTSSSASYKVVITDNHGCSKTSDNFAVTVNSAATPTLTVIGGSTICQGQSTNISATAGYNSYLWSSGQTTSSITVSSAGNYSVTATDANGCTAVSAVKTIIVNPLPQPVITSNGAISFCDGGSVILDAGTGYSAYSWSNGKTTQTVSITASGTFTATVTGTNGCSATSSPVTVTEWIPPTPVITSSSGSATFCANSGVYLTTAPGYIYQWQKSGADIAGATQQNYTPPTGGSYKVVITDMHGCQKNSGSFTATVNTNPAPVISGTGIVCQGSSASLSCGTYSSYLWSTGSTAPSITVSGAGNYTVTVTDANGCTGTSTVKTTSVSPLPVPVITAQGPTQFCDGGSVTLDAGSGYSSYSWSNGKTTQTNAITASGAYSVTVTNSNGCAGIAGPVMVDEWIPPTPTVTTSSGATTFCSNSGVYLTTIGGYSYQWQKSSANVAGATGQNYTPSSGGSYKVIITDNHGCSKTSSALSVTVNTSPAPVISGPATVCIGSSITLSCGTFSSYTWSTGSHASTISTSVPGNFTVTVTDGNGCSGTSPQKTVTTGTAPLPVITASGPLSFCDGGTVTLDAGSGYSSYNWSNAKTTQTNAITASGIFTVTVTNSSGCSGTSLPVTVTEWILPAVNVSAVGPTTYCLNSGTYLTTLAGPYSYQWLKGTANQNGATNQNFAPISSGTYKVKVTDVNGCNKTSTGLKVTVNNLPTASISISGSANICSGQTKVISANTGTGLSYVWKRDGATISGATGTSYTASIAGSYTCVVTNSSGCSSTSNTIVLTSNCKDGEQPEGSTGTDVSWLIYPNPTNSELHIRINTGSIESGKYHAEVRNLLGATVWGNTSTFTNHLISEDLYLEGAIASGVYMVIVSISDRVYHREFVVTKE